MIPARCVATVPVMSGAAVGATDGERDTGGHAVAEHVATPRTGTGDVGQRACASRNALATVLGLDNDPRRIPAALALSNTTLCGLSCVATVLLAESTDTSVSVPPGPVVMSIVSGTPNNGKVTVVGTINRGSCCWNHDPTDQYGAQHCGGYRNQTSLHSTTSQIVRRARVGLLGITSVHVLMKLKVFDLRHLDVQLHNVT